MLNKANYQDLLEASRAANWRVEDIIGGDKRLDFSRPFLPESLARTAPLTFLSAGERLLLNHIRAHGYLAMFELVERFILPFIEAHAGVDDAPCAADALRQFAIEEAKHIELFRRFRQEFRAGFGVECGFIGPAEAIRDAILAHEPAAVAIAILGIEWMSLAHYIDSVKDDQDLDPQFKSLLKHHWLEECQHARLDGLVLQAIARDFTPADIDRAVDGYLEIGAFVGAGLDQQAALDLDAFQRAGGRMLASEQSAEFLHVQRRALHWTFLGSAMNTPNFLAQLEMLSASARSRVELAGMASR